MEMSRSHEVSCVLCHLSVETKTTGALSTKDQVTAHENCLVNISFISHSLSAAGTEAETEPGLSVNLFHICLCKHGGG